jgi:hypothetical protein
MRTESRSLAWIRAALAVGIAVLTFAACADDAEPSPPGDAGADVAAPADAAVEADVEAPDAGPCLERLETCEDSRRCCSGTCGGVNGNLRCF